MKRPRLIALLVLAIGFAALITLTLRTHRDPRIERLIGWHTHYDRHQSAIEREVVEAELASYGPEIIPALRRELNGGSVWHTKLATWIETKSPTFVANYVAQKRFDSDRRRELAALCLGRLGPTASGAIADLKRLAAAGGGHLGLRAEVALTMIARQDPIIQSNAATALTSTSQSRRFFFSLYANDIWPGRVDLFTGGLKDEDESVRANAAQALGRAGSSASNAIPLLLPMLSDQSFILRPKAAFALGLIAPDFADTAVASMIHQRKTNLSWTGDEAFILYQTLGPKAEAAVPALEAELSDPKMAMSHGDAAAALWRITGKISPKITEGLNTGLRIGVQRAQIRCLRIVKEIGSPAAATIPELRLMTNHPLILIRQMATDALRSVESDGSVSGTNHLNSP